MTEDNTQARQKQDIQKLLSGQSLSPSRATTTPTSSPQHDVSSATTSPSSNIPSAETITTTPLREDKLTLAVSFLSSPKVQSADKSKKTAFLKQKGLTNPEIEEAYRRTSATSGAQTAPTSSQSTNPVTATTRQVSATTASTLPPVVPTRIPPSRPTQIIYYLPPDPERLTGKRILALALIFGAGAVGITAGLVSIVKVLISPIFNSIAGYQRNRYNDRYDKLQRLSDTLRRQLVDQEGEGDETLLADQQDETTTTATTRGYWATLIKEQKLLINRLDSLVGVSQQHVADEQEPYGKFKNTLLDLKQVLNRPEYNFSTYTPYSMYGSSTYANRSNTGFDDAAVQDVKSEIRSFKGMLLSRRNFPTAQIKPLPSVTPPSVSTTTTTTPVPAPAPEAVTIVKDDNNNGGNEPSTSPALPASTTTTASYHPRQRQNSYRAELLAKAKAAAETTTTDSQPTMTDSQPNAGGNDKTVAADTKDKSTVIEDITETGGN